jgi:hypothetical protein
MDKPEGYVEPKKPLRPQHGARGDRRHFGDNRHSENGTVEKRVFHKKSEE